MLENIVKGKVKKPFRLMIYGQPGVGKSSFAAGAPNPLFIDAERRTDHLDVARIVPPTWTSVIEVMKGLVEGKAGYSTAVFDTVDHLELAIYTHLCKRDGVNSITEVAGGYGKYTEEVLSEWRLFMRGIEALRSKGINVLMLGHAHVKTFKNPTGEDYDRWQLKLLQKSGDFLRESVDAVGFMHYADVVKHKKGELKAKAVGGDDRMISFGHHPAYESKKGLDLPDMFEVADGASNFAELKL
jgi:hypothetical protein